MSADLSFCISFITGSPSSVGKFNITEVLRLKKKGGEKERKEKVSAAMVKIPEETHIQHEPHFLVSIQLLDK